jgi:HSP20 family protein
MLTRRTPERRVTPFRSALDWFFEDPFVEWSRWTGGGGMTPMVDMRETDDAYIVEAELPGVKPDDAEVTLDGQTLVIRGQYGEERERNGGQGRYLIKERQAGTYTRAITLPGGIDPDRVTSSFANGELTVTLPKAAEAKARRIPVSAGAEKAKRVGPTSSS